LLREAVAKIKDELAAVVGRPATETVRRIATDPPLSIRLPPRSVRVLRVEEHK